MNNINYDFEDDMPFRFKRSKSAKATSSSKKGIYRLMDEPTDDENQDPINMRQDYVNLIDDEAKED